ncbi:MAG: M23 family metallopeptidase [Akkermansiaceae bacterium]|nr:M23 family metallopeptidase [Verrucomicrobiae bacterium]MCP5552396.1 M23 family metallopeptidase [Akkermansiaceae bacterium]
MRPTSNMALRIRARPTASLWCAGLLFLVVSGMAFGQSVQLDLGLPTDNDALFSDDPSRFYMYVDRNFEGVQSKPWSGGRFGFVRDQKRIGSNIIFSKFHEGLDIRPVKRDAAGVSLDEVRSIAAGKVVYINETPSRSNYGRYIVVEHQWGEGPLYSLYAHLASVKSAVGQDVAKGGVLGIMGYSGEGINRERSHVHLELALLLSDRFPEWHARHFTSPNHHGLYNGLNLVGMDVSGLYHSLKADPTMTVSRFVPLTSPYYKVLVPGTVTLDIVKRYPWLIAQGSAGTPLPVSWEITFTDFGLPTAIKPSTQSVSLPKLSWVKKSPINHTYNTLSRVSGIGETGALTESGQRYLQLLTGQF